MGPLYPWSFRFFLKPCNYNPLIPIVLCSVEWVRSSAWKTLLVFDANCLALTLLPGVPVMTDRCDLSLDYLFTRHQSSSCRPYPRSGWLTFQSILWLFLSFLTSSVGLNPHTPTDSRSLSLGQGVQALWCKGATHISQAVGKRGWKVKIPGIKPLSSPSILTWCSLLCIFPFVCLLDGCFEFL